MAVDRLRDNQQALAVSAEHNHLLWGKLQDPTKQQSGVSTSQVPFRVELRTKKRPILMTIGVRSLGTERWPSMILDWLSPYSIFT